MDLSVEKSRVWWYTKKIYLCLTFWFATMKRIHQNNPDLVVEKFTPHCFRHTFATRWLEAGIPIKTVSTMLGHSQLQLTTDLYMHVTQDSLFEGLEQYQKVRKIG